MDGSGELNRNTASRVIMKTMHCTAETKLSTEAKLRISTQDRGALFYADWLDTVFIHYEVDPEELQKIVPFPLDLHDGKAYISLVAFTLNKLRPRHLGPLGRMLFRPFSDHGFLNVRTYVRQGSETGIYFLAEWLNSRLAVPLGPKTFGLPYRFGHLNYQHAIARENDIQGQVESEHKLSYRAKLPPDRTFNPVEGGTLDEFLIERYTAFTHDGTRARFFRIWHEPWPQCPVDLTVEDDGLLTENWPLFRNATLVGANYSPGVRDVWMGFPHRIPRAENHHRLNTFLEMP